MRRTDAHARPADGHNAECHTARKAFGRGRTPLGVAVVGLGGGR